MMRDRDCGGTKNPADVNCRIFKFPLEGKMNEAAEKATEILIRTWLGPAMHYAARSPLCVSSHVIRFRTP